MNTIVRRPLITEKTLTLASRGWYTFVVSDDASKPSIAWAVSRFYKVTVTQVRVISMHGKVRRVGKLSKHTKKADWKKAMVQLAKGQKIDVFEVTSEQGTQGEKADSGKK
ncbi:50S ribosomal protein L23 [Candidatus Gottesmanbacteria bacterium RIFCSPLOWO2_01_FULL_46_9]|uniref:Large ribosomal subunit protein uL23 n=1 Tax=Candidatus Gottesmanbacteria bacterium RIFCSPLOWO2_01_FULL_46_9 TaxID=1798394 RepID=A0A1F6B3J3_9BACT|nr:MAG: 50S ribosomal protein L23 [Candidatus Gottesmanbacteria bacterium RIFCSPLOWO2_01_FULL_46_9]